MAAAVALTGLSCLPPGARKGWRYGSAIVTAVVMALVALVVVVETEECSCWVPRPV